MSKDPFGIKSFDFGLEPKNRKRTLGIRDRQILYRRANGKCEACGKKIEFDEMQVGHIKAYSKGGATTLANSACLCYRCNKLQGTDSLETLKKKLSGTYGKKSKKEPKKEKKTSKRRANNPFEIKLPNIRF
jgi:5-methylcytosine-specific restriction endonuclease McrA